jgi:hypothetical protein
MPLIQKTILVEPNIGDKIKAPHSVFRDDLELYICFITGDILHISCEKDAPLEECVAAFCEDCYLID